MQLKLLFINLLSLKYFPTIDDHALEVANEVGKELFYLVYLPFYIKLLINLNLCTPITIKELIVSLTADPSQIIKSFPILTLPMIIAEY